MELTATKITEAMGEFLELDEGTPIPMIKRC